MPMCISFLKFRSTLKQGHPARCDCLPLLLEWFFQMPCYLFKNPHRLYRIKRDLVLFTSTYESNSVYYFRGQKKLHMLPNVNPTKDTNSQNRVVSLQTHLEMATQKITTPNIHPCRLKRNQGLRSRSGPGACGCWRPRLIWTETDPLPNA